MSTEFGWIRFPHFPVPAEIVDVLIETFGDPKDKNSVITEITLENLIKGKGLVELNIWVDKERYTLDESPNYTIPIGHYRIYTDLNSISFDFYFPDLVREELEKAIDANPERGDDL
jgi:hypothetical protein